MRKRRIFWILLLAVSATTARWVWIHRLVHLSSEELNVCEAVIRYEIDRTENSIPGRVSRYYLSVKNLDPPKELFAKLRSVNLQIERGSLFSPELWKKGAWHVVIRELERVNDRTFIVHGGYENSGLSASGDQYTVVQRDGRWIVDRVVRIWVA